jgi:hypothetical protein
MPKHPCGAYRSAEAIKLNPSAVQQIDDSGAIGGIAF